MLTNQPAILDIIRKDRDRYLFQLTRPSSQPFRSAGSKVWEVHVDPRAVSVLCQRIGSAVDAANRDPEQPGVAVRPFVTLGRGLYDCLLPIRQVEGLRRELNELQGPLLISTDDPDIHWELMTDGNEEGFFCFKYDVGRSLRAMDVPSWTPPRSDQDWRCLIIVANPKGDLPAAAPEALRLRRWLEDRGIRCDYVGEAEATYETVLAKLLEPYDIIHYAGHAGIDDDGSTYSMRLQDGNFHPDNIRTFVRGNPIVFLNGCTSARAVRGLADAFIAAGARLVVGSMFDSPDDGARAFAEKFYEITLSGQPVGEAMRLARQHVKGKTAWGAAWACFIMYGDPCLRIELKVDDLQASLRQLGLGRDAFDTAAGRVLQRAVTYGLPSGSVDTAHLFAAMVGGENAFLRDRLRSKRIPPEALEAAFQEAFKAVGGATSSASSPPQQVQYSANAQSVLLLAKEEARSDKISELDLVRAFVKKKGGGTGDVLRGLGVAITELDPDTSAPASTESAPTPPHPFVGGVVTRIGPLTEADCSADGWRCIVGSADIAAQSGSSQVGTPHLFIALANDPRGVLGTALHKFGLRLPSKTRTSTKGYTLSGELSCSANAGAILLEAQADAATCGSLITERHIVDALVRSGGGSLGEALARQGLVLEVLTSQLFLEAGELDMSKFDHNAQLILESALECASRKRHPAFGRRHVLYGALGLQEGVLVRAVRQQGRDPELLADQIYAEMESGMSRSVLKPAMESMSTDLVSVLCQAEKEARLDAARLITESMLFRAWFADGGGEAGAFLARNGVKLRHAV
jgi:hypothetical protein